VIQPPGTQGAPQQETPNQIQITPDTPSPDNNVNPPAAQPSAPPAPENAQPSQAPKVPEPQVLAAEVVVRSPEGELSEELQNEVYRAIRTQPGRTTTRSQLQEDINAIFATGFFSDVRAQPEDTPLGVRVSFVVQPNPVLRDVQVQANAGINVPSVLPERVVDEIFREQYGSILNLRRFQSGIKRLNKWYQDNGYVLAQVIEAPQVTADGTVNLSVAEGVVEDIQVNFRNKEGEETNERGEPIKGRTREFIITRELELKPGRVFNRNTVQKDLQRVYGLGLFEDVQVSLNPGQDPRKVIVVVNVDERNSGSVAAGAGISSASGLFGTVSYQQQNLGGNNQNLGAELQIGQRELLFDVRFTDPWIAGDPYRTSYTVNAFRRRSISLIFDGGEEEVNLPNEDEDTPRVLRLGGGVNFTRPLSRNPLAKSEWTASAGLQYQQISIRDGDGDLSPEDELGNELSFSGEGKDDLLTLQLGAVRDRRNDPLRTTSGSLLRFGVEQSVPVGKGNILLNRLRGSYSQYLPVNFTNFSDGPETLAFNLQAGTVLGDLPPYEAFSLGGSNSVRGYDEGDVGSGRSFVQATAEYRFPIFAVVGGALFVDVGTDLGTGDNVPGDPAGVRGKPGTGFGYGVGVRVQSPLGPIRIDYGFNDEGDNRLHFGIGERF
jgi:outer membrane protein insertion porin family